MRKTHLTSTHKFSRRADFLGDIYQASNSVLRIASDGEVRLTQQIAGRLMPYELKGEKLDFLIKVGLYFVGNILAKEE